MVPDSNKRVVITGLGVVSPIGIGKEQFWSALLNGNNNFAHIDLFDYYNYRSGMASQVSCEHLDGYALSGRNQKMDKCSLYAVIAAEQAVKDSLIDKSDLRKAGVIIATTSGGWRSGETYYKAYIDNNKKKMKARLLHDAPYFRPAFYVANKLKLRGMCCTMTAACASGTMSIAQAYDTVRLGYSEIMLAGGTDALAEVPFCLFNSLRVVSRDICRPFDKNRTGLILAEGSAILLLESLEHAVKRGAHIYAEIRGYGLSCDAVHMTRSHPKGLIRSMELALQDAEIDIGSIDYINCHGTGTQANDQNEAQAMIEFFGERAKNISVNSIKASTGHMQGTAGSIEVLSTALTIERGVIPATAGLVEPEYGTDFDFVIGKSRPAIVNTALSNSLGFGGVNASIVVSRYEPFKKAVNIPGKKHNTDKRVVLTGIGSVIPFGCGKGALWNALENGNEKFGRISDMAIFKGENNDDKDKLDRVSIMVFEASKMSLDDAGLELSDSDKLRTGVSLESFYGSQCTTEFLLETIVKSGPRRIDPNDVPKNTFNAPGTFTSQLLGLNGPNSTFAVACGSGGNSIGYAYDLLNTGKAEVMLCGGYDELSEFLLSVYPCYGFSLKNKKRRLNSPYLESTDRVLSEGAGIMVMETLEHAIKRNAHIYAEVLGYGMSHSCSGTGGKLAHMIGGSMEAALKRSKVDRRLVDGIFAGGAAVLDELDEEDKAIREVFGSSTKRIPRIWTKPFSGHMLGAAASINTIYGALSLDKKLVPREAVIGGVPDKNLLFHTILVNSFETGGNSASIVLREYTG